MKKKKILILHLFTIIFVSHSFGQEIKNIETTLGKKFDFGQETQENWKTIQDLIDSGKDWEMYTEEEIALIEKYDVEMMSNMWQVVPNGCSWYCGAGDYDITASSELASQGDNTYTSENISDLDYQTAWVEGKDDYGIGESIEFVFDPAHPRLTKIIIANGYIKSKSAWQNNSRVKTLKMFVNRQPYAMIHLKDEYAEQYFSVDPIGYSDREDLNALKEREYFVIRFEIMEVYKGDKYPDTAITEIYFDGIDVH